jgi:hypothetical protein
MVCSRLSLILTGYLSVENWDLYQAITDLLLLQLHIPLGLVFRVISEFMLELDL